MDSKMVKETRSPTYEYDAALKEAAKTGDIKTAKKLLKKGADPKLALFWAVYANDADMVKLLIAEGADPDEFAGSAKKIASAKILKIFEDAKK